MIRRPPRSTLFPYTTPSDLARASRAAGGRRAGAPPGPDEPRPGDLLGRDRKSTRLNSSHVRISYAVFCLKKKNRLDMTLSMLPPAKLIAQFHLSSLCTTYLN